MNLLTSAVDSIDIEYSERKTGDRLLISMANPERPARDYSPTAVNPETRRRYETKNSNE